MTGRSSRYGQTVSTRPTAMNIDENSSPRDVRRAIRRLPRKRRKDILVAIREGREVKDLRDAHLAAAWAERLEHVPWPTWLMPRSRPQGKHAWLWLLHLGLIIAGSVGAFLTLWSIIPGNWRWVAIGICAYSAVITLFTVRQTLRAYWNAPEAAKKNRQRAAEQR
jgi:hypothetical protein